jgi:lactoylglutathione lyase/glyoxylase I family protein
MIKGIAHVCIVTNDLAATERFYCSGLGFKKAFDFVKAGEITGFYLRVTKGSFIEIFRKDKIDREALGPMGHICFEVDDLDDTSRRLESHGYKVTKKSLGADQSWQMWTTDPSGVQIEFHQYTPESTQFTGKDCIVTW